MTSDGTPATLQVIRKGALRAAAAVKAGKALGAPHEFADPDGVATLSAEKCRVLIDNPLSVSEDDPVQILGARGGRIAGRLDVIAGRIDVKGEAVSCLWASYLYVPPEARSTLLGVTMLLKLQQLHPNSAVCGVSQIALPLYQKLRWRDFAMPRHIRLRRSRSVVERYVRHRAARVVTRVVADAVLGAHRVASGVVRGLRTRGLSVEPAARATPELDIALAAHRVRIETHRSADYVNWLLGNASDRDPNTDPRTRKGLFYVRTPDGQLAGYFVIRARFYETATHRGFKNLYLGSLQDWRTFDRAALPTRALVQLAIREIDRWDPDAVEVCLPPDCADVRLRQWGFVGVGALHLLVRSPAGGPLAEAPATDWVIRPADGDNFFS
jgi:hypothetical protein